MHQSLLRAVIYRLLYQSILFIASLLVARMAGAGLFGIISLMIVNTAAFIIVTDFGTGAALVWHGAGNEIQALKIFSFGAATGLVQLSLFMILEWTAIKLSGKTLLTRESVGGSYLFDEVIYFIGVVVTEKYTSLFYGQNKAGLANKTLSIVGGCFLLLLVLDHAGLVKNIGPLSIFCSMFLAMGLAEAVVFHVAIHGARFSRLADEELRSLLSFSLIVFSTNIIQFFAYRLDFWLIDHFFNSARLGIYAQANRFAQLVWVLPVLIAAVLIPAMRSTVVPLGDKSFLQVVRLLNLASLLVVACVIIGATLFYHWFFQHEYSGGLSALILMLPGYLLFATSTLLAAWFAVKRLLKVNLVGSCLCFALILASDLVLIPRFGLNGAGVANTIAYSITTLYFVLQFKKHKGVSLKELFLCSKGDFLAVRKYIA